jgi:hypothetical protein
MRLAGSILKGFFVIVAGYMRFWVSCHQLLSSGSPGARFRGKDRLARNLPAQVCQGTCKSYVTFIE